MNEPLCFQRLVHEFSRLPSVGRKSATRLAFHILKISDQDALALAQAIIDFKSQIRLCSRCFGLCEDEECAVCQDSDRDQSIICVVEKPEDISAVESAGFRGMYHVLHGALSPLDMIGPDDLKIEELLTRTRNNTVKEIIMATNPTVSGEATADYISSLLGENIVVSRLAYGISAGSGIEYADAVTLRRSLEGRRRI